MQVHSCSRVFITCSLHFVLFKVDSVKYTRTPHPDKIRQAMRRSQSAPHFLVIQDPTEPNVAIWQDENLQLEKYRAKALEKRLEAEKKARKEAEEKAQRLEKAQKEAEETAQRLEKAQEEAEKKALEAEKAKKEAEATTKMHHDLIEKVHEMRKEEERIMGEEMSRMAAQDSKTANLHPKSRPGPHTEARQLHDRPSIVTIDEQIQRQNMLPVNFAHED